jgi:single-strand DNA-binding protein
MNQFNGIGRLTKDPECRYTQGETPVCVARYTLAIDRQTGKNETDFLSCVCFGKTAEFAEKYLAKGVKVGVSGRVQTGTYKNKNGDTVYTTDIVVNSHTFCEKKGDAKPKTDDDGFAKIPDGLDESLPFM